MDICQKMETGMADYAHKAATTGSIYLETVTEYDLYCHYVAGLVGEGLSRLFAASGKEEAFLAQQLELSNSMGLLLQKTNIIRDFREDCDQRRYFWPQEIWGKAEYGFKEINEMCSTDQNTVTRATWVQSGMILNALGHAIDALDYLRLLKNQSIFNFCAIPAAMAIATLELCFMNKEMFQRNIKIRKAEAAAVRLKPLSPPITWITNLVLYSLSCGQKTRERLALFSGSMQGGSMQRPFHRTQISFEFLWLVARFALSQHLLT